jgi:hypothetical protein
MSGAHRRFVWTPERDAKLAAHWLSDAPAALAAAIGCALRSVYKRAAELRLPPRDPVARALAGGKTAAASVPSITLPELRLPRSADDPADGFVHHVENFR